MLRQKLGISASDMRSLAATGVIVEDARNSGNYALYNDLQVQKLLRMQAEGLLFDRSGALETNPIRIGGYTREEGLRVFELLAADTSLVSIVSETRLHPVVVAQIKSDFDEMSGSIRIPRRILDQMNGLTTLSGSFPLRSASDVLEVMQCAAEDRTCSNCSRADAAGLCYACIHAELAEERPPMPDGRNDSAPKPGAGQ
jgi:hypothetical protein